MMRYFRASNTLLYDAIRADLDAAYGYPNGMAMTAICPASQAPADANGRVYLMASEAECDFPIVADLLPRLLVSGSVDEVARQDWDVLFTQPG